MKYLIILNHIIQVDIFGIFLLFKSSSYFFLYGYIHHLYNQNLLTGDFLAGEPERDLAKSTFLIDRPNSSSFLFLI